jgi:thioredoxin-related protein
MAGSALLPAIDDLRALTAQARSERLPILLFFSTEGCPYCLEVRRNYLAPRVRAGHAAAGALIREIDIGAARRVPDLDGKPVSEAELARRYGVRMTPVVLLVDWRVRPLGPPLVGIDAAGFYESYLANAIDSARRKLAAR